MKIITFFVILFSFLWASTVSASVYDEVIWGGSPSVKYCQWGECGIDNGINIVEDALDGSIETDRSASEYIQDIVVYLLWFVSLIAVIYIIYSGFQILIWSGDEEKLKNSKKIILYVILWIILMWLAWPITNFIFDVLAA